MNLEAIPERAFQHFYPKQVQGNCIFWLKNLALLWEIPG